MHSPYITDERPLFSAQHVGLAGECDVLLRVSVSFWGWVCVWRADSFRLKWMLLKAMSLWECDAHCIIAVCMCTWQLWFPVKKATFLWCLRIYVHAACMWKKNMALLMKTIVWFSNVLVFFCVFQMRGPTLNTPIPPGHQMALWPLGDRVFQVQSTMSNQSLCQYVVKYAGFYLKVWDSLMLET